MVILFWLTDLCGYRLVKISLDIDVFHNPNSKLITLSSAAGATKQRRRKEALQKQISAAEASKRQRRAPAPQALTSA